MFLEVRRGKRRRRRHRDWQLFFFSRCYENSPKFLSVPSAGLAATPGVRSMAPSKRRKTTAVLEPACGNATSGVRTKRSASARGDLPDAPDADLDPVDECATFSPDGNVATVIYSHIADVQTRGALAMASRSWRDVSMLPASLPRRLDLDGLSKSQIDRLLDVDELTSLDEERMLELAGVDKEDFCEWAAARAGCLKLIVWALERGFRGGDIRPASCRMTSLPCGHGVRFALNCRSGGRRLRDRRIGKG